MKKKIIITIIAAFLVTTFGGLAAFAYVRSMDVYSTFSDYAELLNNSTRRFKHRNTLTITRLDIKNNRVFVLFDVEYLLKMDNRKQFMGEMMTNGVARLTLGWVDQYPLMDDLALKSEPALRDGRREYFEQHTLFREYMNPYYGFQIPDMIEVELPAGMMRAHLAENGEWKLYYYLEAFGFYTDGVIDYSTCYKNGYWGIKDECILVVTRDDKLEYIPIRSLNPNFIEAGGSLDDFSPDDDADSGANEAFLDVMAAPYLEPDFEIVPEVAEPESEPEPESGPEQQPVSGVIAPEEIAPEPGPELELEPEVPEVIELEPELELEPETVEFVEETEVMEPDAEPEEVFEVAGAPSSEEIVEPENDKLALELGIVALATKIKPTGGETAVKTTAFSETLAAVSEPAATIMDLAEAKREPELILAPNTGYRNREKAWEFLILPLIGVGILAVWWFWPFKIMKKIKKSLKKVLTFFAISDKMVTVY
ncbi:hypothetical protein IKX64_00580 [Candidatus Saccharibacteria bacterium]|nr:hypothetical protein [Candidatus Saccharibacteria bacterium]